MAAVRYLRIFLSAFLATIALVPATPPSVAQEKPRQPPVHGPPPPFFNALSYEDAVRYSDGGTEVEHHRTPADELAEHRRIARSLAALAPQRKGVVDAYVVSIALDSDGNFSREAREAARVLARRYDAAGRSITLAGPDGRGGVDLPRGSPAHLGLVLARIAEVMDRAEDVLVLYTTSHGARIGVVYNDGDNGFGIISPARLAAMLDGLGIKRRLVIVSACYSGSFVPALSDGDSAVLTASVGDRTSFGCQADNDWTFFGDALINQALRKAQPLDLAAAEAARLVSEWEARGRLQPSLPQSFIGDRAKLWLAALDQRTPKAATAPVGTPAVTLLDKR
ncbi:MAG: peptidase C13 [Sphingomonas sp.]|uniref:C13 family peptidase n=1 Tax=Sphingomonas sp. TaxID=28214 RepID=UPI00180E51B1|nr:peptidase C13 [Sphingomonas sp.]